MQGDHRLTVGDRCGVDHCRVCFEIVMANALASGESKPDRASYLFEPDAGHALPRPLANLKHSSHFRSSPIAPLNGAFKGAEGIRRRRPSGSRHRPRRIGCHPLALYPKTVLIGLGVQPDDRQRNRSASRCIMSTERRELARADARQRSRRDRPHWYN